MDLGNYLSEELESIIAINIIAKLIREKIGENFHYILRGEIDKDFLREICSLITAILMITYCMHTYNRESYLTIDPNYSDDFTFDSMMYEN